MSKKISIREIADDRTTISSTRWAFASIVKFDILVIFIVIVVGLVAHFLGKDLGSDFYGSVAMLLGILTGFVSTTKALQGFETKKDKKNSEPDVIEENKEEDNGEK